MSETLPAFKTLAGLYTKTKPMKKILIIYYTQSGQLTRLVNCIAEPILSDKNFKIDIKELEPETPFPFPWTSKQFFNVFPECVLGIPDKVKPLDVSYDYDLIILGYQPWYLSPSMPMQSFLASEQAAQLLKGKPVITIIGSRNMWLIGQEKMKKKLLDIGAKLVGNIAFFDRHPNLVSLVTIIGWAFYNKKNKFLKIFPNSGVSETDIAESDKFGQIIKQALGINTFEKLQENLVKAKGVEIFPSLLTLEMRAIISFRFFAKFIRKKGDQHNPKRMGRVKIFQILLSTLVFVVSPIVALLTVFILLFNKKTIRRKAKYFMGVDYLDGQY